MLQKWRCSAVSAWVDNARCAAVGTHVRRQPVLHIFIIQEPSREQPPPLIDNKFHTLPPPFRFRDYPQFQSQQKNFKIYSFIRVLNRKIEREIRMCNRLLKYFSIIYALFITFSALSQTGFMFIRNRNKLSTIFKQLAK